MTSSIHTHTLSTTLLECRPPDFASLFESESLGEEDDEEKDVLPLLSGHYELAPHLVRERVADWKGELSSHHRLLVETAVQTRSGTLVAVERGPNPRVVLESMPVYVRLGIRLLFGARWKKSGAVLRSKRVEEIFRKRSVLEGIKFDSTQNALKRIKHFIRAYDVDCSELLEPRLDRYRTLNDFFYRKLRPSARPIASASNPSGISSAADCRLTVYSDIDSAQEYWIKGRNFTLKSLLANDKMADYFEGGELACFRLAPADYHRFHSPVDAVVGRTFSIPGQYLTVQPTVVNNPSLDVFTENRRDVTYLHVQTPRQARRSTVAFVQVGAMLVGSIRQTVHEGAQIRRGDELGYFAYGGSTIVVLFPRRSVDFSADLLANSRRPLETIVKMGEEIGVFR